VRFRQKILIFSLKKNVFEEKETREILQAGKEAGLELNFHGDELTYVKAGELGGELNALAISHLEHISDEGIISMSKKTHICSFTSINSIHFKNHTSSCKKNY